MPFITTTPIPETLLDSLRDSLEDYYIPEPNSGCWLWCRYINRHGYGAVKHLGKVYSAHRISLALYGVNLPPGAFSLHSCDVRCCINPDHLRPGSVQSNASDMALRGGGTAGRGRMPYGVAKEGPTYRVRVSIGGRKLLVNTYHDLTEAAVAAIEARKLLHR